MRKDSRKAIEKPIIKRCCLLYEMLLTEKKKAPRDIQHSILDATLKSARRLMCSINSYTGMMCYAKSFNRQRELMYLVLQSDYCKYLYFVQKNNHLVCQVFDEYKEKTTSTQNIVQLCKQYKKYKNEYRKSKCCA